MQVLAALAPPLPQIPDAKEESEARNTGRWGPFSGWCEREQQWSQLLALAMRARTEPGKWAEAQRRGGGACVTGGYEEPPLLGTGDREWRVGHSEAGEREHSRRTCISLATANEMRGSHSLCCLWCWELEHPKGSSWVNACSIISFAEAPLPRGKKRLGRKQSLPLPSFRCSQQSRMGRPCQQKLVPGKGLTGEHVDEHTDMPL